MPPVFLIRKRYITSKLLKSGAVSPETAKTLAEAGVFNPNTLPYFTYLLVKKNIIGRTEDGKYYLK